MAIFSFELESRPRSAGRSSVQAAAYALGVEMVNQNTGEIEDESNKFGVFDSFTIGPGGDTLDPHKLWSAVEMHHKRRDAVPARVFICALPAELTLAQNTEFVKEFVSKFTKEYGVAATVGLHLPDRAGDQRNYHAHIVYTACAVEPDPEIKFGKKVVALDPISTRQAKLQNPADKLRKEWEIAVNSALYKAGSEARVDCRSLKDQMDEALASGDFDKAEKLDRPPGLHLGAAATGFERRTGEKSERRKASETRRTPVKILIEIVNKAISALEREMSAARAQLAAVLRMLALMEKRKAPAVAAPAAESKSETSKAPERIKGQKSVKGVKQPERTKEALAAVAVTPAQTFTSAQRSLQLQERHRLTRVIFGEMLSEKQVANKQMKELSRGVGGVSNPIRDLFTPLQLQVLANVAAIAVANAQKKLDARNEKLSAELRESRIREDALKEALAESLPLRTEVTAQAAKKKEADQLARLDATLLKLKSGEATKATPASALETAARLDSLERVQRALELYGRITPQTIVFAAKSADARMLKILKGCLSEGELQDFEKSKKLDAATKKLLNEAIAIERPSTKQPPTGPQFS
jgi:hypothetical protein